MDESYYPQDYSYGGGEGSYQGGEWKHDEMARMGWDGRRAENGEKGGGAREEEVEGGATSGERGGEVPFLLNSEFSVAYGLARARGVHG